jgi:outer membrane lipoprotein LolB
LKLQRYLALSLSLLFVIVLPACSSIQQADVDEPGRIRLYQTRSDQLAGFSNWNMVGRLAVRNSDDGGSGHFSWRTSAGDSQMDFHGALGRGAWRLVADAKGAELELADGTVHRADSIDELVRLQLGWEIPVDRLSWWVRGLVAPGDYEDRMIDDKGNLSELLQGGWTIEYGKYDTVEGISLPLKLTARQADWKVKLAIRDWQLLEEKAVNE